MRRRLFPIATAAVFAAAVLSAVPAMAQVEGNTPWQPPLAGVSAGNIVYYDGTKLTGATAAAALGLLGIGQSSTQQYPLNPGNQTGTTAIGGNLYSLYGLTNLQHASANPNNATGGYYVSGEFGAQAAAADGGAGQSTLTATASAAATSVSVSSGYAAKIRTGDYVTIALDNGALFTPAVTSVSGTTVNISPGLPSQATSGNAIYDYSGHIQAVISTGILAAGATNFYGNEGAEFSLSTRTGSSVYFKCLVCGSENSDDVVQADSGFDMGFGLFSQAGAIGMKKGLYFSTIAGGNPVQATGTMIYADAMSVAHGLDFSKLTFSSDSFKVPGVTIDPVGEIILQGVEGKQLAWTLGGQEWDARMQSNGPWYIYDATNSKIPFVVDPNSSSKIEIASTYTAITGVLIPTGITKLTGSEDSQIQMIPGGSGQEWHVNSQASGGGGAFYVLDKTNNKFPFVVDANSNAKIEIASAGIIITGGITAGASAGVTCAGSPTVSFATTNGIVTHC